MTVIQGVGTKPRKPFAGSYSKLKNFEGCPTKYNEIDQLKNYVDSDQGNPNSKLAVGDRAHKELAAACMRLAPLKEFPQHQSWVDRVHRKAALPGAVIKVEQQYAIRRDFSPCTWFAKDAYWRAIGDVVILWNGLAMVTDWKTGKVLEDSVQLGLMAQVIFAHYADIERVITEFVWLQDDCTSTEMFDRQEVANMWANGLLDRVAALEGAYNSNYYPPKPSGLCIKHCPVQKCQFYRKGKPR